VGVALRMADDRSQPVSQREALVRCHRQTPGNAKRLQDTEGCRRSSDAIIGDMMLHHHRRREVRSFPAALIDRYGGTVRPGWTEGQSGLAKPGWSARPAASLAKIL
jgi:hypothetical protein